jgi:hypothetical protein
LIDAQPSMAPLPSRKHHPSAAEVPNDLEG